VPVIIGTPTSPSGATLTAFDLLRGALRRVGALAAGETPSTETANDTFALLQDWLDQLSNEKSFIFCTQEVIHEMTSGKFQYTIGQSGNDVGCAFTGAILQDTLTVSAISSGALSVGQIIQGTGIQAGTAITSLGTGLGGNGTAAIGTYKIYPPSTFLSGPLTSYAPRPLRINSAMVRVTTSIGGSLDYPVDVISVEDYELIGLKALNGPWPKLLYYQPSMPQGILNYWPNPNNAAEMHLFVDTIFNQFPGLYSPITFPQGYKLFLRFGLAELLMPDFGKAKPEQIAMIVQQASNARKWLKQTNQRPQPVSHFDVNLLPGQRKDAGWILHGGFN
jgi:hypothetical protein